jgi:hypothetical protein
MIYGMTARLIGDRSKGGHENGNLIRPLVFFDMHCDKAAGPV